MLTEGSQNVIFNCSQLYTPALYKFVLDHRARNGLSHVILTVRKEESGDDGGGEYYVTIKEPSRDRVEALFPCRR